VQVYASDPWYPVAVAAANIRNLAIAPPAALPLNYYPSTIFPTDGGFTLTHGNLWAWWRCLPST